MNRTGILHVLLIEDEALVAHPIEAILQASALPSFRTHWCPSLAEGIEALRKAEPDVIVLDLNLPDSHGIETVARVRAAAPTVPVVVLSGESDDALVFAAMQSGAQDYLVKGALATRFLARAITYAVERKSSEDSLRESERRHRDLAEKLRQSLTQTVRVLSAALERRDPYTAGHQRRVAALACAIGRALALDEARIQGLHVAGTLHDVGKIAVPSEILVKPTSLSDIERLLVQTHAQVGCDILCDVEFPWPISDMVLQHHERLDGSGYPQGLAGGAILSESSILGVADVVEAMSSHRPYRSALGIDVALEEIRRGRDRVFTADAVDACVEIFGSGAFRFD